MEHVNLKGWKQWWRRRRRELRAESVLDLSTCSRLALHEARCRARIAKILGKPTALKFQFLPCEVGDDHSLEFGFVLRDRIDRATRRKLEHVPGLLLPLGAV